MSLKILAGLVIVFGTSLIGNVYAARYRRKRDFFIALENFTIYLKREISFSANTLKDVVAAYTTENGDLSAMLSSSVDIFGTECFDNIKFPEYIAKDEAEFLGQYLSRIGRSGRKNEIELTANFIEELKKYREAENSKCVKTTALSTKLGFFAGIIIFVIIM